MDLQQNSKSVPAVAAEDLAPGEPAITIGEDGVVDVEEYMAWDIWMGGEIDSKGSGQFERTQRYIGYLRTAIADHKEEFVVRPHAYYMLYALLNASERLMPEEEREAAKEEAQAALLQAAQWWHGRALAELYRQYACMDEKKRDVRKAAKYYRAAQQAGWVYVEPRCEILTHPASIARYQARELSKQDSDELSDLEEDELAEKDPTMVNASRM